MAQICSTRLLKNAKFLQRPEVGYLPAIEPAEGFQSLVPAGILERIHSSRPEELGDPRLANAISKGRPPPVGPRAVASLFSGTIRFVQLTVFASGAPHSVPEADLTTALRYAGLCVGPISAYASQYGPNRLAVGSGLIPFQVSLTGTSYNDQSLAGWTDELAKKDALGPDSCLVFLNPPGVVNVDADSAKGVLGYHSLSPSGITYSFVNLLGQGLTVGDENDYYALALSHEIAEATVDPQANGGNPEASDNCSGNCNVDFRNYFDLGGRWMGSSPTPGYGFFTAGVVKPPDATKCPAPPTSCSYPPPAVGGSQEMPQS
jgi:hypothetical protein